MRHPDFVTPERFASICRWPASDRRHLVKRFALGDLNGRPVEHKDELTFWSALLNFIASDRGAYRAIAEEISRASMGGNRRQIHHRCYQNLLSLCPAIAQICDDATGEFERDVCVKACDAGAVDAAADWLWAHWKLRGEPDFINSVIEADEKLNARFGSWRAPLGEAAALAAAECFEPAADSSNDCASLFDILRDQVRRASETASIEILLAARATIGTLIDQIQANSVAEAEASQELLRETILRLGGREAPADANAAVERAEALNKLANLPDLPSKISRAAVRDIEGMIEKAEEAKQTFLQAEAAHWAARFDPEKSRAYLDAISIYGSAEIALTDCLEGLVATIGTVAVDLPSPAIQPGGQQADETPPTAELVSADEDSAFLVSSNVYDDDSASSLDTDVAPDFTKDFVDLTLGPSFPDDLPSNPENLLSVDEAHEMSPRNIEASSSESAQDFERQETAGDKLHPDTVAFSVAERFLRRRNIGLFAITCEVGGELGYGLPPSEVAVALATSGMSEPLQQLQFNDAVTSLLADHNLEQRDVGEVCLLFAALSLPAVTDPTFISRDALSRLKLEHADFSSAIELRRSIDELGRAYSSVQEFQSSGGPDPEEEFRSARAAAQQTAQAIRSKTVNYHAATVVAHRLAQELALATDQDASNIDAFVKKLQELDFLDHDDDEVIRRIDRLLREGKADRKPIEARALISLKNIVREVREAASRLLRAATALRERRRAGFESKDAAYRKGRDLQGKFVLAAVEFRHLAKSWNSKNHLFAEACALASADLLDEHAAAFDSVIAKNAFYDSLELDRFRIPALASDPQLLEARWTELQKLADDLDKSWLDAFEVAVDRREHRATAALLRVAQPLAGARKLANEREEAIGEARDALQKQQQRLKDELLTVMNYAPPGETSLDPLYQSLASIDANALPLERNSDNLPSDRTVLDFPDAFAEIEEARRRVNAVKTRALTQLEDRLQAQVGRASAETIEHLRELFENSDLITLSEELSLIERGQDIAIAPPEPIVVEEFSRFLVLHGAVSLAEWQAKRPSEEGRAIALIRKWQALKSNAVDIRRGIRDLFGELGFEPKSEAEAAPGAPALARVRQFKIRTSTISDREFCSVARFGSEAEGQYRVLLAPKDAKPNEIVTAAPEGDTAATFVFVPHWIPKDARLQIASEARRLGRTFCLIDDALIAFLCDRDRVIHDLFGCGIPFAAASPYVTTPGSIPVEAFFGRAAELTNIGSRDGSCIVYGGRQLGKSVLLDHLEKRGANRPDFKAIRLDCQDMTERREILSLIERKLPIPAGGTRGNILAAIETWLKENPERAILLMLDETNKFVRADADRNFELLLEFRGLMERTNRRFKVVLSGQNNVLRLTQTPNTPLAHFGQPICIGPLKGADYKAARDLVAEPLAAVGYKFAEDNLISRILVETQFYPKLVQMFCRDLLNHMRSIPGMHSELPPWKITLSHVEATLRNQRLTKDIFETFKITLDLDKRYELIALIMAFARSDQRKRGGIEIGMSERELRDNALIWWKDGFTSSNTREEFEGLLEELEGLGILINDRSTHSYQLASPVIANLIGSESQIYDGLLSFDKLPPVRDVEPSKRRAEDNPPPGRRGIWLSPLIPAQVNRIVRARRRDAGAEGENTFVIYGSPDMRLDRILPALEPRKYDEHQGILLAPLGGDLSVRAFSQRLATASKPTFFIVSSNSAWDASWVEAALRSERGHVIVFVGNLEKAWAHIVEDPRGIQRLKGARIETAAPLSMIELEDQVRRSRLSINVDLLSSAMSETGGFLGPVGRWTERHAALKRDQKPARDFPHFETMPATGRQVIENLVVYAQPDDSLDCDILRDACSTHDPKRIFDWLLWTGLAELAAGSGDQLRLNKVFWSDDIRQLWA